MFLNIVLFIWLDFAFGRVWMLASQEPSRSLGSTVTPSNSTEHWVLQHTTPVCTLCATIQIVSQARGWRLKHTETDRERQGSTLMQECPLYCVQGPQPKNTPETISLPSGTPEDLVLRAAVGTQIRGKQEIQDLGVHSSSRVCVAGIMPGIVMDLTKISKMPNCVVLNSTYAHQCTRYPWGLYLRTSSLFYKAKAEIEWERYSNMSKTQTTEKNRL